MIERSRTEVVPAVFFAQPVQHLNRVVCAEFLSQKVEIGGRHGVGQQVMQSSADAIDGTMLRLRTDDTFSKDAPKMIVVQPLNDQQIPSEPSQAGVDINGEHSLRAREMLAEKGVVFRRAFFKLLAAEEQALRIFILASSDRLHKGPEAKASDHSRGLHEKEIMIGLGLWTQERIHA